MAQSPVCGSPISSQEVEAEAATAAASENAPAARGWWWPKWPRSAAWVAGAVAAAFAVIGAHVVGAAGIVGFAFAVVGAQVWAAAAAVGSAVAAAYTAIALWRRWITSENLKKMVRRLIFTQIMAAVIALLLAGLCGRAWAVANRADCGSAGGVPTMEAWFTGLLVAEGVFVCIFVGAVYTSLTVFGREAQRAQRAAAVPADGPAAGAPTDGVAETVAETAEAAATAEAAKATEAAEAAPEGQPQGPGGEAAAPATGADAPLDAGAALVPLLLLLLLVTAFVFVWGIIGFVAVHHAACEGAIGWAYALITLSLVQCFGNVAHAIDIFVRRGGDAGAEEGDASVV